MVLPMSLLLFQFARLYPLDQKDMTPAHRPIDFGVPVPTGVEVETSARDYTPPQYLTLLLTDLGVLTPSVVSDELIQLYLWSLMWKLLSQSRCYCCWIQGFSCQFWLMYHLYGTDAMLEKLLRIVVQEKITILSYTLCVASCDNLVAIDILHFPRQCHGFEWV